MEEGVHSLFLQGFGLQIGSDLYLLFDQGARHDLAALAARMMSTASITGTFVSDNGTFANINHGEPLTGTFSFVSGSPFVREHIIDGCYRPPGFPWYLQPFPWWTQFIIVPIFSILSSLANLQPFWTVELVVMVVISCVSYAANKVANHFIFNRSDVVSAIGAFAVGLLGNIYSRKMGGTAFTSMVTGVLFLVPVSGAVWSLPGSSFCVLIVLALVLCSLACLKRVVSPHRATASTSEAR